MVLPIYVTAEYLIMFRPVVNNPENNINKQDFFKYYLTKHAITSFIVPYYLLSYIAPIILKNMIIGNNFFDMKKKYMLMILGSYCLIVNQFDYWFGSVAKLVGANNLHENFMLAKTGKMRPKIKQNIEIENVNVENVIVPQVIPEVESINTNIEKAFIQPEIPEIKVIEQKEVKKIEEKLIESKDKIVDKTYSANKYVLEVVLNRANDVKMNSIEKEIWIMERI